MTDIDDRRLRYCEEQLAKAETLYREARDTSQSGSGGARPSRGISDCQQAIEIAAKTLFWLTGNEPPKEHEITWDNAQAVLRADMPGPFYQVSRVPRVMLSSQFWGEFYLTAKYGEENYGVSPDELFDRSELELAVEHARFCTNVAQNLLQSVRTELKG